MPQFQLFIMYYIDQTTTEDFDKPPFSADWLYRVHKAIFKYGGFRNPLYID